MGFVACSMGNSLSDQRCQCAIYGLVFTMEIKKIILLILFITLIKNKNVSFWVF